MKAQSEGASKPSHSSTRRDRAPAEMRRPQSTSHLPDCARLPSVPGRPTRVFWRDSLAAQGLDHTPRPRFDRHDRFGECGYQFIATRAIALLPAPLESERRQQQSALRVERVVGVARERHRFTLRMPVDHCEQPLVKHDNQACPGALARETDEVVNRILSSGDQGPAGLSEAAGATAAAAGAPARVRGGEARASGRPGRRPR